LSARPKVSIVDYGSGNLLSVKYALERCGADVEMLTEPQHVLKAGRVVLPGVGAFPAAMQRLSESGLDEAIIAHSLSERPLLGICLGMQLLAEVGEEFQSTAGLGLIPGRVRRLPALDALEHATRVPFSGWASVAPVGAGYFTGPLNSYYYFVHSFCFDPIDREHVLATYRFHGTEVVAAVGNGRTIGVQFHPERSGPAGLALIEAFIGIP
jgi:glutamine amidotransferase